MGVVTKQVLTRIGRLCTFRYICIFLCMFLVFNLGKVFSPCQDGRLPLPFSSRHIAGLNINQDHKWMSPVIKFVNSSNNINNKKNDVDEEESLNDVDKTILLKSDQANSKTDIRNEKNKNSSFKSDDREMNRKREEDGGKSLETNRVKEIPNGSVIFKSLGKRHFQEKAAPKNPDAVKIVLAPAPKKTEPEPHPQAANNNDLAHAAVAPVAAAAKITQQHDSPAIPQSKSKFQATDYYGTGSVAHHAGLKQIGLESVSKHSFKSPFVVDPHIYNKNTIRTAPGVRKTKTISCFNCPKRFYISNKHNKDFKRCPYSECVLTNTDGANKDADIMIFWQDPGITPPPRPRGQIWVYMSWETPPHRGHPQPTSVWLNTFNSTISYRMDADFWLPYDYMMWRDSALLKTDSFYLEMAKGKTKTAAWWVSHCNTRSKREHYVREMQKYVVVDIYGACGNLTCDRGYSSWCWDNLNTTYKFYLSFENSLCKDYVTEKFFKMYRFRYNIVPVVRSAFDYKKYIPPNMFVDAADFASPKELALHLKALGEDHQRYAHMLKEKDRLTIMNRKMDWCDFCEKVHTDKFKTRRIREVKEFTNEGGKCWDEVLY